MLLTDYGLVDKDETGSLIDKSLEFEDIKVQQIGFIG